MRAQEAHSRQIRSSGSTCHFPTTGQKSSRHSLYTLCGKVVPGTLARTPVIIHDDEQTRMKADEPCAAPEMLAPALFFTPEPSLRSHVQQPLATSHVVVKPHHRHERAAWRGDLSQRSKRRPRRFPSEPIASLLLLQAGTTTPATLMTLQGSL